ncbi:hypothetical protein OG689_04215 [Kitasatospora sp. NBC_00240]|uniref:hypothetical protein n=1 Tax=Kitasatospora sp. NBC_00240 TaxID=2903567 RepID=UPI002258CE87|nr:hypothetical protein [Kitasatospora sp. NBC_00240]MCX5208506.1 hypothetical protein [Kitasatospora sp. NBC_00240]
MKYCPTCRRHVNGAISCPGCGIASNALPDAAPEPVPTVTVRLLPPRSPARPSRAGGHRPLGLPAPAGTTAGPGRRSAREPGLLPALLATCVGAVVLLVITGAGSGSAPPRSSVLSAPIGGDAIRTEPPGPGARLPLQALVAEPLPDEGDAARTNTTTAYPGPAARPGGVTGPAEVPAAGGPAHPGPSQLPGAAPADPPRPPAPSAGVERSEPTAPPSAPSSRPPAPAPAPVEPSTPGATPPAGTGASPTAAPSCLVRVLFVCLS